MWGFRTFFKTLFYKNRLQVMFTKDSWKCSKSTYIIMRQYNDLSTKSFNSIPNNISLYSLFGNPTTKHQLNLKNRQQ